MNVAKSLLWAMLALPVLELAAFIAVAVAIGFLPALALIAAGCFAGLLILRHAGGNHISRMRVAWGDKSFTALATDDTGSLTLLAAILLLIPGFITDVLAILLLIAPLRRALWTVFGRATPQRDGVVDLAPEQWRRVPDPELPDRREDERR